MAEDIPVLEKFTVGDTRAIVYVAATDRSGAVYPLTGWTLTIEGRRRGDSAAFSPVSVTVTDNAAGEAEADVASELCADAGDYRCQIRFTETADPTNYFRSDPFRIVVRGAASAGDS